MRLVLTMLAIIFTCVTLGLMVLFGRIDTWTQKEFEVWGYTVGLGIAIYIIYHRFIRKR